MQNQQADDHCQCQTNKKTAATEGLSLVSSLSGGSIFVCGFCHSFWICDEDGWELLSSSETSNR